MNREKHGMKQVLAVAVLLASPQAMAAPSFDCRKANGKVEALICQDAGLMALDNTLAKVYSKALADMAAEDK
ncbi:lysozyme inhibitor LprI family protein [Aeromonas molluscorum]|uniref:lysozyme inhibitor LprI family protein n=1 Tax=Aeromonas molluscorum TaxID=271417 RepID=UPI0003A4F007